ncbi:hypothetical protein BGW39_010994 [Mortierella sp. 14UC]|nr:hypothetical protein BGW39_010994 [Mortierella sp. 14UC]
MAHEDFKSSNHGNAPADPVINPGPLGLSAFALTTFVLSLFNVGAGVPSGGPIQVVTGLACFYGGITQMLAGMWEFKVGNNFGATAFTCHTQQSSSPALGIVPAYDGATIDSHALDNALGIFLLSWGIFTFILWIATLRSTVALSAMFFVLTLTFFFLASGHLAHLGPGNYPTRVGGGLGIVTALLAWYNAVAGLYVPQATFVRLPVGPLGHTHSE